MIRWEEKRLSSFLVDKAFGHRASACGEDAVKILVRLFHGPIEALREALCGELLRRDACSQRLFSCAHGCDDATLLGGGRLDALRDGGRLGFERRRVEAHQAMVIRGQRDTEARRA